MAASKLFNFSAGPATLPARVLERASEAVRELRGSAHAPHAEGIGLSLLEISHRSADFTAILERATALCHEVLEIPSTHAVVFLQGGASQQFAMVPMNLARTDKAAAFIDTGVWSKKAIRESKLQQETLVAASSGDTGYDRIPAVPELEAAKTSYLHIHGTQWRELPQVADVPVVADLSSDIGCHPMDFSRLALGYAGAQKNLGPSGVTLVFIEREFLASLEAREQVPYFFRYATHVEKQSVYNTPNTFGVLVLQLVLEWLRDEGGLEAAGRRNREKAALLYDHLDASSLFVPHAQPGHRSLMNVRWSADGAPEAEREAITQRLLAEAKAAGLVNLKGHRSVGGFRASIYNAFPLEGVRALVEFLREFEARA